MSSAYNQRNKCALAVQGPDRRTGGRFCGRYGAWFRGHNPAVATDPLQTLSTIGKMSERQSNLEERREIFHERGIHILGWHSALGQKENS